MTATIKKNCEMCASGYTFWSIYDICIGWMLILALADDPEYFAIRLRPVLYYQISIKTYNRRCSQRWHQKLWNLSNFKILCNYLYSVRHETMKWMRIRINQSYSNIIRVVFKGKINLRPPPLQSENPFPRGTPSIRWICPVLFPFWDWDGTHAPPFRWRSASPNGIQNAIIDSAALLETPKLL